VTDDRDSSNHSDSSNCRAADIMISLSVGLLVGVAGALLLAPSSGRNTRRRIGEMAGEVADTTVKKAVRASDAVKEQAARVEQAFVAGKQAYRQAQESNTS
jgi:gas vesicle protein